MLLQSLKCKLFFHSLSSSWDLDETLTVQKGTCVYLFQIVHIDEHSHVNMSELAEGYFPSAIPGRSEEITITLTSNKEYYVSKPSFPTTVMWC